MSGSNGDNHAGEGGLTRKQFVAGALKATSAVALLPAGVAASAAAAGRLAPAGVTAQRGGTLRIAEAAPLAGLDPAKWWRDQEWTAAVAIFDRLIDFTNDGRPQPQLLAALPSVSRGATLYTFRLRPGVRFHTGRALTADDVKFSLERLVSPKTASEGASLYTPLKIRGLKAFVDQRSNEISGIKVVNQSTFTIELEQPDSVLIYVLGLPFASIVPRDVVERAGDNFNWQPVGTGPFVARNVNPNTGLVLERNAGYWRQPYPYLDRVEWAWPVNPELQVLRIQRGDLDLSTEAVPPALYGQLRNNASLASQLIVTPKNDCKYITLSLKERHLKNVKVRQAIASAVDKQRLARALGGQSVARPATGGLFSPLSPYYQPGLSYGRNLGRARQLLREAGYGSGFEITFLGHNEFPHAQIGPVIQQDLREIGIRVNLRLLIKTQFFTQNVKNPAVISANGWDLPYPHGSYMMDSAFTRAAIAAGCCNFSNYVSPTFDALVGRAHRTADPAELATLYKRMDRVAVREQVLWVPMFYPNWPAFVPKRVGGYGLRKRIGFPAVIFLSELWLNS